MQCNRLLNNLRRKDQLQLLAACDEVDLCVGDILSGPPNRIQHVYFPLDCFISQLLPVESHENLEVALVGNEGMLGVPLVLGVNLSTMHALLQNSGTALRMSTASFRRELESLPALRLLLHRYVYVLQAQLAQKSACMRFHSLDLRLARQLLITHDQAGSGNFRLTHKLMAQMLGVRRVGVTNAAGLLQKRRLLSYSRGDITILDRAGLEKASCVCYQASKDLYARVLG